MKTLIFLASIFSLSLTAEIIDVDSLNIKNLEFKLDDDIVEKFLAEYEKRDDSTLTAILNDYTDKILKNVEVFATENNMDPLDISDVEEDFLGSSIKLTSGKLSGISTIARSGDVTLSYGSDANIMELFVPFSFTDLTFDYNYDVTLLLIAIKGSLTGTINDFEMKVTLQFDLNTYHAKVIDVNTADSGTVSVKFQGNGVIDEIVNILTKFVTEILHPQINTEIAKIIKNVADLVVDSVNEAIDNALNRTTTVASLL